MDGFSRKKELVSGNSSVSASVLLGVLLASSGLPPSVLVSQEVLLCLCRVFYGACVWQSQLVQVYHLVYPFWQPQGLLVAPLTKDGHSVSLDLRSLNCLVFWLGNMTGDLFEVFSEYPYTLTFFVGGDCLGTTLDYIQGLLLVLFSGVTSGDVRRTIGMPGIKPGLVARQTPSSAYYHSSPILRLLKGCYLFQSLETPWMMLSM